jgi:Flp pilus assembly pilin Flp
MSTKILERFRKEDGATATEYVLLLIGIALIVLIGATVLGNALSGKLSDVGDAVSGVSVTIP